MRIALAVAAVLLLGACNVSKDSNSVTVQYDQNTAENTAAAIGNTAQNIGGEIAKDVQNTGDKIENKVGKADVHVTINKDEQTNSASGDTTTTTKKTTREHKD